MERESQRDEWTIVELDAIGGLDAGDVRFRLVQHLLRDGAKRGAVRFHVACADADGNVELFMQAGFARYGDERVLFRAGDKAAARADERRGGRDGRHPARGRRRTPSRSRGCTPRHPGAGPAPRGRPDGGLGAPGARLAGARAQSLTPILRFADVEAYVQEAAGGGRDGTQLDALVQVGVAKEDQPHYLKVLAAPGGRRRTPDPASPWA